MFGGIRLVRYKVLSIFLHNMFDEKLAGSNILAFYKLVCVLLWYVSV
jgi:hypothetical protein